MEKVEIDIKAINPNKSKKYSPNLYRWLTKRDKEHRTWTSRVFADADGYLWIGMIDNNFLCGCRLMQVLCSGRQIDSMAYSLNQIGPLTEVVDFWPRYLADGRCAIDQKHREVFRNDGSRWQVDGDVRKCQWCGKVEQKKETYTVTHEYERWVDTEEAGR